MSVPIGHGYHLCDAAGCGRTISKRLLMCGAHWRLVPAALRQRLYRAWDAVLRGDGLGAVRVYREAKRECVEAVNAALGAEP